VHVIEKESETPLPQDGVFCGSFYKAKKGNVKIPPFTNKKILLLIATVRPLHNSLPVIARRMCAAAISSIINAL